LSTDEILELTGGLTQPQRQLEELHKRGFWRARLNRRHEVLLERDHYEAVCRCVLPPTAVPEDTTRPMLQPIGKRAA
jgi:hypothetical protein